MKSARSTRRVHGDRTRRVTVWAAAAVASLWCFSLVAAPYLASHHLASPYASWVAAAPYAAGRFVCHQQADRSFLLWNVQMPVRARCLGLYAAAPLGVIWPTVSVRRRRRSPGGLRAAVLLAAVPIAALVAIEWLGVASPGPWVRAIAALPLGAVAASLLSAACLWGER